MNKVQQAAGRVIRTMEDKGIILLLDERFVTQQVVDTFPAEWEDYDVVTLDNVEEKIQLFWKQNLEMKSSEIQNTENSKDE